MYEVLHRLGSYSNLKCNKCNHDCHCDSLVCSYPIGQDMSKKSVPCGCGVCECTPSNVEI
jgi:hypothetical protein